MRIIPRLATSTTALLHHSAARLQSPFAIMSSPMASASSASSSAAQSGTNSAFSPLTATSDVVVTSVSNGTASPMKPIPSFYRRPLPESCVALSSRRGRQYFASAMTCKGLKSFFPLMEQHTTQIEPAYCGISTLTVCLNALAVDPRQNWKGPWRWYEESMLNCCMDLEQVKLTGITMKVFHCLARCQGLTSHTYYLDDQRSTLEHFRAQVCMACVEEEDGVDNDEEQEDLPLQHVLVVSYNRQALGQTGTGHFSPIGAYDANSDSVLILDTARFKYGVHWVPLPLMYEAMKSIDPDTGRSRGYVLLSHIADAVPSKRSNSPSPLPVSILFRTQMKQHKERKKYKRYLKELEREPSWDEVLRFWTQDLTHNRWIWNAIEAQIKPCSNEVESVALIQQVRALLKELIPPNPPLPPLPATECLGSCRPNGLRSLDLASEEAIFVVYLASLTEEHRHTLVSTAATQAEEVAKEQLLAEAELFRYALDWDESQDDDDSATTK